MTERETIVVGCNAQYGRCDAVNNLKAENEELKKYQYKQEYLQKEIEIKQQKLEKIEKICNFCTQEFAHCDNCEFKDDCYFDIDTGINKISGFNVGRAVRKIINEVENGTN